MPSVNYGPWVGEFGWELFCWQGWLRKKAKTENITIACRPGHEILYQDFAKEIITFDPKSEEANCWECYGYTFPEQFSKDWVLPHGQVMYSTTTKYPSFNDQTFVKYGTHRGFEWDLVVHARQTDKCHTGIRNFKDWDKLDFKGMKVACIGTVGSSIHLPGTVDLRGKALPEVIDVLANARAIIGPSSGPMHLASLCGCPQIVWSPEHNRVRYEKDWNPFNTPVTFISTETWQPPIEKINNLLSDLAKSAQQFKAS